LDRRARDGFARIGVSDAITCDCGVEAGTDQPGRIGVILDDAAHADGPQHAGKRAI
jgi:hypothetical protein